MGQLINAHKSDARITRVELALIQGASLVKAKAVLPIGVWSAYVSDLGITTRTAQRYMILHRAGITPMELEGYGVAESEKYASLGLRLWPIDGRGREISIVDKRGDQLRMYVIPLIDGRSLYIVRYPDPEGGDDFVELHFCDSPFDLGMCYDIMRKYYGLGTERVMTKEEARVLATYFEAEE